MSLSAASLVGPSYNPLSTAQLHSPKSYPHSSLESSSRSSFSNLYFSILTLPLNFPINNLLIIFTEIKTARGLWYGETNSLHLLSTYYICLYNPIDYISLYMLIKNTTPYIFWGGDPRIPPATPRNYSIYTSLHSVNRYTHYR